MNLPRGSSPKESPLVTAVLDLAAHHPHLIRLWRCPSGEWTPGIWKDGEFAPIGRVRGAPAGTADLSGFVPFGMPKRSGMHVAIECKRDAYQELTEDQIQHLSDVVKAGGIGIAGHDVAVIWAEYLDAVGMCERGGLIVLFRKRRAKAAG